MEIVLIGLLGVLVVGAVALPLIRGNRGPAADAQEFALEPPSAPVPQSDVLPAAASASAVEGDDAGLEGEVARYRQAVSGGTLCRRCGEANPPGSRFCRDCGKPLTANDAQEYA